MHAPKQTLHSLVPVVSVSEHALAWVRACELPTGGLRVYAEHPRPYPEVTGYCTPTLLEYGERSLSLRLVRWLASAKSTLICGALHCVGPSSTKWVRSTSSSP
jgi:hypothetical protein